MTTREERLEAALLRVLPYAEKSEDAGADPSEAVAFARAALLSKTAEKIDTSAGRVERTYTLEQLEVPLIEDIS